MAGELILLRHAPIGPQGILCGHTDCDIAPTIPQHIEDIQQGLADVEYWVSSPARRCQQSFEMIFGKDSVPDKYDERLWEQNFGEWEGCAYDQLPDIGNLSGQALADFSPPGGESFSQLAQRCLPAFLAYVQQAHTQKIGIVAHAGIIRSFIGHALGNHLSGLPFVISELSVTRIAVYAENQFAIKCTNSQR